MTSTVFVNGVTLTDEDWFNDTNAIVYDVFSSATTAALARTALSIVSGTYTPTLANTTNISASAAFVTQYMRVNSVVTVSGVVTVDPVATGATTLGVSLPIASAFSASEQAGGAIHSGTTEAEYGAVFADAVNDRVTMTFVATSTASHALWFSFTYLIV